MTTSIDIAKLVGEYVLEDTLAAKHYAKKKELEYALISALREKYPDEWNRWERGISSFTAEGVTVELKRQYDPDKVRAEFGEERPDLVTTETKVVEKVDGRKIASLWKDAAYARRLENCLIPGTPKVKVK